MSFSLRSIGGNALAILTSDVLGRATSLVLYAMVARRFGAFEFGQMSLALSLFYLFQVFAAAGLKILIVRQVARDRSQTSVYLCNGCAIVTASSLLSFFALFVFVRLMHYSPATNAIVLLLAPGLLPYSISSVCEGIFQAWERMGYIAWVNVPANIAKMVAAYVILAHGLPLDTVILVLVVAFLAIAVVEVWMVLNRLHAHIAPVSLRFCWNTLRSSFTFLALDNLIAIEGSMNVVFLSKFAGEAQVGLFSAATQLMVPLWMVYRSIAQSIFPVMCRRAADSLQDLKRISENALEGLLALAIPAVAALLFLGPAVLSLLYKNPAFLGAVPPLRIMSWTLIFQVFSYVLGQVLLATHRERLTLRIVGVLIVINLSVGALLIWRFGLLGAALAVPLTGAAAAVQHYIPVSRLLSGIPLGRVTWRPIVAAACMGLYLALAGRQFGLVPTAIVAALIYAATFLALAVLAAGGLQEFKNKYLPSGAE